VLRWFGRPDQVSRATDLIEFQMRQVHAGRSLVVEGQPFEKLHLVSSGSFKCVQTDMDGYEQVLAFAIHGDIIGLDGLGQTQHRSGAVALEDASVVTLPIRDLLAMGREVPALESLLHHAAGAEVSRCGDTQYLMAAPSSEVRVARFLLQFARRQSALGHSGRRLRMCMTRRDIASHLGVAHETVSRVLTALDHDGYISVSNRDIELVDLSALQELQRVTRGRQSRERRADTARRATARALVKAAADSATGRFVAGHANAQ
jgi:CRP/FNR family transcriptional regulator